MKLSFSQLNKFNSCARAYKLHYNDRLREKTASAFLVFGSAIDDALNYVLRSYRDHNYEALPDNYRDIFDKRFSETEINKRRYNTIDCTLIGYSKNDFIEDLLTTEDRNYIRAKIEEIAPDLQGIDLMELKTKLEDKRSVQRLQAFPENEHRVLNIMNYLSMRRKAHYMLDAYVRDIVPQIEEVRDIQLAITLDGGDDSLIGYIDAVVKFKGNTYYSVLDNKTSASPYELDRVKHSQQLSLYCYATGLNHAAFGVMLKNILLNRKKTCIKCGFDRTGGRHKTCSNEIEGKRCPGEWDEVLDPKGVTQLFQDEIPESIQEMFVDNVADINTVIKAGVYSQNFSACHNMWGSRCIYYNKCWKGTEDDLEKV